jgi:hypothetical protein
MKVKNSLKINLNISTINNTKLLKSNTTGFLASGLTLYPYELKLDNGKTVNSCKNAKEYNCHIGCLKDTGLATIFPKINEARKKKAKLFYENKNYVVNQVDIDLQLLKIYADNLGLKPSYRFNVLSDINAGKVFKKQIEKYGKDIVLYDYTKRIDYIHSNPYPDLYNIVYSLNCDLFKTDIGISYIKSLLAANISCVVVLPYCNSSKMNKHGKPTMLPDTIDIAGIKAYCADNSDTREQSERGKLLYLSYKGTTKKLIEDIKRDNKIILPKHFLTDDIQTMLPDLGV